MDVEVRIGRLVCEARKGGRWECDSKCEEAWERLGCGVRGLGRWGW